MKTPWQEQWDRLRVLFEKAAEHYEINLDMPDGLPTLISLIKRRALKSKFFPARADHEIDEIVKKIKEELGL